MALACFCATVRASRIQPYQPSGALLSPIRSTIAVPSLYRLHAYQNNTLNRLLLRPHLDFHLDVYALLTCCSIYASFNRFPDMDNRL